MKEVCACAAHLDKLTRDLNSGRDIGFAIVVFRGKARKRTKMWYHGMSEAQLLEAVYGVAQMACTRAVHAATK